MPVPTPPSVNHALFPTLKADQIDAMRTSSWYDTFIEITPKSSFIDLDTIGEKAAFLEVCSVMTRLARADGTVVA